MPVSNLIVPRFRRRALRRELPYWREGSFKLLIGISATLRTWIARRHGRRDLRDLAERGEDHLLDDIGVTREDALRVADKWFWQR